MSTALTAGLRAGLILLLLVPLVITPTLYPTMVGKALYARGLIEILTALWVVGLLWKIAPRPPRSWVLLAFAAYVIISVVSAFWGVSFTRSIWSTYARMTGVWDLFHWFLIVVVATAVIGSLRDWRTIINCNLAVALFICLLALAQAYGLAPECRLKATLGHPSYLAAILAVTTTLAVGLLVQSFLRQPFPRSEGKANAEPSAPSSHGEEPEPAKERNLVARRIFWAAVAFLGIWVLLMTGTRGALLGLVGGALIMPVALVIWGNRRAWRPVLLASGLLLSAVAALFAVDWTVGLHVGSGCGRDVVATKLAGTSTEEGGVAQRLGSAKAGIYAFIDRPLLGWGPENFEPAFERFVDPSFFKVESAMYNQADDFKHAVTAFDDPHNKVIGELATKGALGALAYLFVWGAMVWAILRRRRPHRDEVFAYAVLGALTGFFIQNLFLFDTPATLLQLALLMAWVASQERGPAAQEQRLRAQEGQPPADHPAPESRGLPWPVALWGRGILATGIVMLLGFSLYHLTYQPYSAARDIVAAFGNRGTTSVSDRLTLARTSFDTFPPLANLPRAIFFNQIAYQWDDFSQEEKSQALRLVTEEVAEGLDDEPLNFPVMVSAVLVLRQDPTTMPTAESLLERIREVAPERVQTHVLLAEQELLKGNPQEAVRIAEEYESRVPGTEWFFQEVKRTAQNGLLAPD